MVAEQLQTYVKKTSPLVKDPRENGTQTISNSSVRQHQQHYYIKLSSFQHLYSTEMVHSEIFHSSSLRP